MLFTRGGQGKTATITKSGNSQSDSRSTSETDTTPDWTETSAKQQIENPPNLQNEPQRKKTAANQTTKTTRGCQGNSHQGQLKLHQNQKTR